MVVEQVAAIGAAIFAVGATYFFWRVLRRDPQDAGQDFPYNDLFLLVILIVPVIAAMSYAMMALGYGFTTVNGVTVPYLRYFEWAVSTPILLFSFGLLCHNRRLAAKLVGADFVMILAGMTAEIVPAVRYPAFAVSMIAFFGMLSLLYRPMADAVEMADPALQTVYRQLRVLLVGLWSIYPIVWMLGHPGTGIISVEHTFLAFLVLDLAAKLGFAHLLTTNIQTRSLINVRD